MPRPTVDPIMARPLVRTVIARRIAGMATER